MHVVNMHLRRGNKRFRVDCGTDKIKGIFNTGSRDNMKLFCFFIEKRNEWTIAESDFGVKHHRKCIRKNDQSQTVILAQVGYQRI